MPDKLAEIMEWKRREIAAQIRPVSERELSLAGASLPRPPSFASALRPAAGGMAVIAEIKRRSPSAGAIAETADAGTQALRYRAAGAAALSVLTDQKYFGGRLSDLSEVTALFQREGPAIPCLRKDFMVHPIQVLEARTAGASAILVIVRALGDEEIKALAGAAAAAGLDALFEIHDPGDLERAIGHGARIIGVNNRDLSDFTVDLGLSERLIPTFPRGVTAVSESGIVAPSAAARVRAAGAHAILVGEALMRAPDTRGMIAGLSAA